MASTYIQRVDSTDGNRKVWTWSAWVKRDVLGSVDQNMFSMGEASADEGQFKFSSDQLSFFNDYASSGRVSASQPSRKFRDVNGWYHFVWRHKSDESTASDRWKIYINGERLDPSDYGNPSIPNEDGCYNKWSNKDMWFGARAKAQNDNSYQYFSGLMSHIHFCDGYAYDASDFGSTDSTTGEWKINVNPNVQYGSKGFFILKDGNSVTDQSGNGNNCTVGGGTLTPTVDNPSNVFATLNPLTRINTSQSPSKIFNNANTTFEVGSNVWGEAMSTLAVSSGKYYVEFNIEKLESSTGYAQVGVMDYDLWGTTNNTYQYFLSNTASAGLRLDYRTGQSSLDTGGSSVTSNVGDFVNGDKIGLAVDMDNKAMYVHKNGVYYQVGGVTGVPTSGSSKTGALTIPASCTIVGIGCATYSTSARISVNYGNGYFRTTAVSSNSGNGYSATGNLGIFQYQPPTGYTALCTKGLNT